MRMDRPVRFVLAALIILLLASSCVQPARADDTIRVFYAGHEGSVKTALDLAKFTLVSDPVQADVLVLNGQIPSMPVVESRLQQGAGLLLILGPSLTQQQVSRLLGLPLTLQRRDNPVSLSPLPVNDPLVTGIAWNGAPQVRERFDVETPVSSVEPLIGAYESGSWILWQGHPHQYILNAFLDDANLQIQEWAYFNYLIYHLVERAAARTPLSFADYPASPVPHAAERNILFGVLALLLV